MERGRRNDYSARFDYSERLKDFESRYDMSTDEVQDLERRKPKAFKKYTFDVAAAQTDPLVIYGNGRAFVVFGFTTASSATTKTVASTVILNIRVGEDLPELEWSAKHNRGYRGDFNKLFVRWPAQSNNSAELYVFQFDEQPYTGGEAAT